MKRFTICRKTGEKRRFSPLLTVGALLFWLLLWWGAAALLRKEILLPSPGTVGARLFALVGTGAFWKAVGNTVGSILLGLLTGALAGGILGILSHRFSFVRLLFAPFLTVVRATPVASFIVLLYVWLSKDTIPGVITFLMVLPVIEGGVTAGFASVDPTLREVSELFGYSRGEKLKALYLPAMLPGLRAALVNACGLGWKAGVAAEALVRTAKSIGGAVMDAKMSFETVDVFAWTVTVIAISMLLEWLLRLLLGTREE